MHNNYPLDYTWPFTVSSEDHLVATGTLCPGSQQAFPGQGGAITGYAIYSPSLFPPPVPSPNQTPTRRHPRPRPGSYQCQKCQRQFSRRQERDRHLQKYFPHWIYCPSPRCPWRGDRPDVFKKHWEDKHNGAIPVRKQFEIYSPKEIVEFITLDVMSVDEAAAHARVLVDARKWELGKQDVWENSWGRKGRKVGL